MLERGGGSTPSQLFDEYDIIIVGGGAAGGVILARLAADPSLRILMLEAGPTKDDLAHIQPARYLTHIVPDSDTVKHVVGKPGQDLNGRQLTIQCGNYVGGGSSVGWMVYTQPAASDYDNWANVHGNPGWSLSELLPLIKKIEIYQVAPDKLFRGYDGPLKVSRGGAYTDIGSDYIAIVAQYDKIRPVLEDSDASSTGLIDLNRVQGNWLKLVADLMSHTTPLADHPLILMPFLGKDADSIHPLAQGDSGEREKWSAKWHEDGQGLMGANGLDGVLRYRPTKEEVRPIGPDFAERLASFYADAPDKPVLLVGQLSGYSGASPPPAHHKVFITGAYCSYPAGTGSVHITSAHDVDSPADFDTGVFNRKEDLAIMRHAWKLCREHARRMSSYRGEYALDHPEFPPGSAAVVSQEQNTPVPIDTPDIVYTKEDDQAIDDLLKAKIVTAWNSLGTCAMKPRNRGGVVDSRLNVYGVQNLKVADMSICPSVLAANGCATAALVGEKAALIIGEEIETERGLLG